MANETHADRPDGQIQPAGLNLGGPKISFAYCCQINKKKIYVYWKNALSSDFQNKCISLMSICDVYGRGVTESMIS